MPILMLCGNIISFWGLSSVGRALAWHARGRGFESHRLHFCKPFIYKCLPFSIHLLIHPNSMRYTLYTSVLRQSFSTYEPPQSNFAQLSQPYFHGLYRPGCNIPELFPVCCAPLAPLQHSLADDQPSSGHNFS